MAIKEFDQVVQDLIAAIQSMQPNANLQVGSLMRDVMIDAPASEMAELFGEIRIAQQAQSVRDARGEHLDRLLANWAIYRKPGEKAKGTVWFYRQAAPLVDVVVPVGTRVRTSTTISQDAVEFVTTQTVTMLAAQAASYYNDDENRYEIQAPIEAAYRGVNGNVGPNTIMVFTSIVGVDGCTNRTATTGGSDEETDEVFRARGLSSLAGTNAGTQAGYEVLVEGQVGVDQATVVDPNDPYMERVRDGGGADVWVKTRQTAEVTDSYAYEAGEINRRLEYRPAVSISAVRQDGALLVPGVDYGLALDTDVYARSIYSNDRIWWISLPPVGSNIEITYVWCDLIKSLQDLLDADEYHHAGADILAKLCYKATVDVTMKVEVFSGYNPAAVTSAVNVAIAAYIDSLLLGVDVQQSDIISIAESIAGVDSVVLPLTVLPYVFQVTRERSGIVDGPDVVDGIPRETKTGNLIMRPFEYAIPGIVTVGYYV